jgi:F0F1-type ATP synthase membrane subunit b/b'
MTHPVIKSRQWRRLSCAWQGADKEETMSKATTIKVGLAGAAALLMLSACASRDEVSSLDNRVAALETRLDAADARATQAEAAANQCTATCQDVEARAERMIQQSVVK